MTKTQHPLYKRLGEPPKLVWAIAENLFPSGIKSPDRSATVASPYTDSAIPSKNIIIIIMNTFGAVYKTKHHG
jgi:hypothetical protein